MGMHFYDLNTIKVKKRNFLIILILAFIPLLSLAGYQFFSIIIQFIASVKNGMIIPGILAFLLRIFVGIIILIIGSVLWLAICCYIPLKNFHEYYCKHVFSQAVLINSDYSYVHYNEQLLDTDELVKREIIYPNTVYKQKKADHLTGRYKNIDFEIAPLSLNYGKMQEIEGSIAIFTGLTGLFNHKDFVQISCSSDHDVFAEYLPEKRGLEVKKRISTNDYRNGLITAPKKQVISEEQLKFSEQLIQEIAGQRLTCFYIIFSQGRVYFIDDGSSLIINLPLWHSIEKEVQHVERNGIANVNMFINSFNRVMNMHIDNDSLNPKIRTIATQYH